MSELLHCPKCKNMPDSGPMSDGRFRIICLSCGREFRTFDMQDAIAAWNHRAGGWQPIETAPKDGQYVMLMPVNKSAPVIAFFSAGAWDDGDYNNAMANSEFTHWMPLPDPPEVEE